MFVYSSHLGYGVFYSDRRLDYEETYCDECGDSDNFLGEFYTRKQLKRILKNNNFNEEYINNELDEQFEKENK